jgi:hypothetical protein
MYGISLVAPMEVRFGLNFTELWMVLVSRYGCGGGFQAMPLMNMQTAVYIERGAGHEV